MSVHHFWFRLHFVNSKKPLFRRKTKPDVSPKRPSLLRLNSRSRRKMQGVANVSFLAMFLMYLLAALFGYLTFNGKLGLRMPGVASQVRRLVGLDCTTLLRLNDRDIYPKGCQFHQVAARRCAST